MSDNFTSLVVNLVNSSGKVARTLVFAHLIDKGANSETCWAAYSSALAQNLVEESHELRGFFLLKKEK